MKETAGSARAPEEEAGAKARTTRKRRASGGDAGDRPARILAAAGRVFERDGLEAASLRAIAAEAGYTPAALYFHFESKEALYAALLIASLERLAEAIARAVEGVAPCDAAGRLRAGAMAFFAFYADAPRDLDLGFYLYRGGMQPRGLGRERDARLNAALVGALSPLSAALSDLYAGREQGLDAARAAQAGLADIFAHATGLLLSMHTGRLRLFGESGEALMRAHLDRLIAGLQAAGG